MDGRLDSKALNDLALQATRALLILLAFIALVQISGIAATAPGLSWFLFLKQDIAAIVLILVALILMCRPVRNGNEASLPRLSILPILPWFAAAAAILVCWAGHYLIFHGYDLTRDEQMANFDAWIIAHGRLFWSLPPQWRGPDTDALNQMFMLSIGNHEVWMSNYLPGNATIRAFVGTFVDPALTSPALVALGALALWKITRRQWPERTESAIVALFLYLLSPQILFTGMTAYAMNAHLALNLVWLALFLNGGRAAHIAALLVGFVATGLHQPIFHPMFVAPFLLMLLLQTRWSLLGFYAVGYIVIGIFWLAWPALITQTALSAAHIATPVIAATDPIEHIMSLLHLPDIGSLWLMALNVLRFVSWQHLLFMPLLFAGLAHAWRSQDPFAYALTIGLLLPLPIMLVLLAYQGHGWGYRYLHGVLGNAFLICIYGWHHLGGRTIIARQMRLASAATILLLIPLHGFQAWQMTAPYALIDRQIANSHTPIAIIDDGAAPYASDLVLNRPDLSNRPIRLSAQALSDKQLARLCGDGADILVIDGKALAPIRNYFFENGNTNNADLQKASALLGQRLKSAHCRTK